MKFRYKLSICMIVKDEEKFIDKCLKSLKPLMDLNLAELIIVDTGSTDNTIQIAKKYTEKIYFKEWNNNFSESRNYSISFAKGEYIFIMDADQDMDKKEINKLIKFFESYEYKKFNTYSLVYKNFMKEDLSEYAYFSLNIIFKNDGEFRYEGKVHNQPIFKKPIKHLDIYMNHYGYIMTEDIKEKKFKRTATLLLKELDKDPNNIYYRYQLSRSYEMHGDNEKALYEVNKYLSLLSNTKMDNKFKINYYHNAAIIYFNAKKYDECIYYSNLMLEYDKELIDSYYLIGKCNIINNNIDKALINLKLYLKYISIFKYEKYADMNGLEIFSYEYKSNVIIEIIRIKISINQLNGIEKYINDLEDDLEKYMLIIKDILKVYIKKGNMELINKSILKIKNKDKYIILYYIISKIIVDEGIDEKYFLENLHIGNEEKNILNENIKLEKENQFKNLLSIIKQSFKLNKIINIECCIEYFIDVLNNTNIYEIEESNYIEEIVYIMNYLIERSGMITNFYLIEKEKIIRLMEKYNLLIKNISEEKFNLDKEFSNKIYDFNKYLNNNNLLKAMYSLKEAIFIKPEFGQIISILKDLIEEKRQKKDLIGKDYVLKIKENIITLIDNNMNKECLEILDELEKIYSIELDIELICIKSMLKVWDNKIDEAEKLLEKGVKNHPKNLELLNNLAYIYSINNKKITSLKIYYYILSLEDIDLNLVYKNINKLEKEIEII